MQLNHSAFETAKFANAGDAQTIKLQFQIAADLLVNEFVGSGQFALEFAVLAAGFKLVSEDCSVQEHQAMLQ